ncbi:hypothetical protein ATI02_1791 [Pseudomonas baetica]|uniref:Type VI secretion system secreted protein Hcp n=1 Tax=Pseudomonas baetica TaxID=674054 RepID=A0ABX4PXN1_9PSED|nr:hypothetical protein [Pseudomonas baetica]PKA68981.1 hypothetical protein ATI02_1791 [Pseudomonas baetica]PTC19505.1 hypothetical protein C0J26_14125 [Pseudomonas baetica]
MSKPEIFSEKPVSHEGQKGVVSGTIKGQVKNLTTEQVHDFDKPWIWRDTQQGTLRFHGVVNDPEAPGKEVAIGLQLSSASQPSGEFKVGDPKILHLSYMKYGEPEPDVYFRAESGLVTLQRQANDHINGSLKFETITIDGNQYAVDVIYDIGAP